MKPELPSSNAFWLLCSAFRDAGDAAHRLIRSGTYSGFVVLPCVFLYFRSIELGLKAVLVANGVPKRQIALKLGHRISELLKAVEEFVQLSELEIGSEDRELLVHFSDDYSNKWFEYSDDFWKEQPKLELLKHLASRVCDSVRIHEKAREPRRRRQG